MRRQFSRRGGDEVEKNKSSQRELVSKATFTLRIPQLVNEEIKALSNEIGISQNDLILMFVKLGMKIYKEFIPHQREELLHFLSQIQK